MICPRCEHWIPEDKISCPHCALRKSREAYEDLQALRLTEILAAPERESLPVSRVRGSEHIQLLGERIRAFCGMPIPSRERRYIAYQDLQAAPPGICEVCRQELERLIKRAAELVDDGQPA